MNATGKIIHAVRHKAEQLMDSEIGLTLIVNRDLRFHHDPITEAHFAAAVRTLDRLALSDTEKRLPLPRTEPFQVVARAGFEPAISALRGRRPGPLDERAKLLEHNEPLGLV